MKATKRRRRRSRKVSSTPESGLPLSSESGPERPRPPAAPGFAGSTSLHFASPHRFADPPSAYFDSPKGLPTRQARTSPRHTGLPARRTRTSTHPRVWRPAKHALRLAQGFADPPSAYFSSPHQFAGLPSTHFASPNPCVEPANRVAASPNRWGARQARTSPRPTGAARRQARTSPRRTFPESPSPRLPDAPPENPAGETDSRAAPRKRRKPRDFSGSRPSSWRAHRNPIHSVPKPTSPPQLPCLGPPASLPAAAFPPPPPSRRSSGRLGPGQGNARPFVQGRTFCAGCSHVRELAYRRPPHR
jgi:hypothetical protein